MHRELWSDHPDDALQVVDRGKLDGDLAFAPTEVDPHPSVQHVGQPIGEFMESRGRDPMRGRTSRRPTIAGGFTGRRRHDFLGRSYRQAFGHDPSRELVLGVPIGQRKQRARMAGGDHASSDPPRTGSTGS